MFKFSFRRSKKASRLLPEDIYDLNEQELENLDGGTLVRHLLYPSNTPRWIRSTATGLGVGETSYSTQVFSGSQWQSGMDGLSMEKGNQTPSSNYWVD